VACRAAPQVDLHFTGRLLVVVVAVVLGLTMAVSPIAFNPTRAEAAAKTSRKLPAFQPGSQSDWYALGDSYMSGEGTFDYYGDSNTGSDHCHRSPDSYAGILGVEGSHFPACSGAKISQIESGMDGEPSQVGRVSPSARLILLSASGDSLHFSSVLKACLIPLAHLLHLSSCAQAIKTNEQLIPGKYGVEQQLVKLLGHLHNVAPHAWIVVVGYPRFFPNSLLGRITASELCGTVLIRYIDQLALNRAASVLDTTVVARAVTQARGQGVPAWYVDTYNAFSGHELCSQPTDNGALDLNTLTLDDYQTYLSLHLPAVPPVPSVPVHAASAIAAFAPSCTTQPNTHGLVCNESFHPTVTGYQRLAQVVKASLQQLCSRYCRPVTTGSTSRTVTTLNGTPITAPCAPSLYPDGQPRAVVILADGIASKVGSGAYTPADIHGEGWNGVSGGYCSSYQQGDGNAVPFVSGANRKPAGLESLFLDWAGALLPYYDPSGDQAQLLTDALGLAGAAIVPYSYRGATLAPPPSGTSLRDAVLTVNASSQEDPGTIVPKTAANTLEKQISSIHGIWPKTRILVVGHSEAGLVVETWWEAHRKELATDHVDAVFSLDAPLNGVSNAVICENGVSAGLAARLACGGLQINPPVAHVWASLWKADQSQVNGRLIAEDVATGSRFIDVGTDGDPVYSLGDYPNNYGLGSQLWHTGACIGDQIACNYNYPVNLKSACVPGPGSTGIGLPGHVVLPGHGLVMNCTNVVAAIIARLKAAIASEPTILKDPAATLSAYLQRQRHPYVASGPVTAKSGTFAMALYPPTQNTEGTTPASVLQDGPTGWQALANLALPLDPPLRGSGTDAVRSGQAVSATASTPDFLATEPTSDAHIPFQGVVVGDVGGTWRVLLTASGQSDVGMNSQGQPVAGLFDDPSFYRDPSGPLGVASLGGFPCQGPCSSAQRYLVRWAYSSTQGGFVQASRQSCGAPGQPSCPGLTTTSTTTSTTATTVPPSTTTTTPLPVSCGSIQSPTAAFGEVYNVTATGTDCAVADAVATASENDATGEAFQADGFSCPAGTPMQTGPGTAYTFTCTMGNEQVTFTDQPV
jgi:hypothetical protein